MGATGPLKARGDPLQKDLPKGDPIRILEFKGREKALPTYEKNENPPKAQWGRKFFKKPLNSPG